MKTEISQQSIAARLESSDITTIPIDALFSLFREEKGLKDFAPDGRCREDIRDGSIVVFNAKRAQRPHDNQTDEKHPSARLRVCPVCEGQTTGILDVAPLSSGVTFINKNLFPCFYVGSEKESRALTPVNRPFDGNPEKISRGLHFLQWTSSRHEDDWHNMPVSDLTRVIERLAALEKKLLFESEDHMPSTAKWHDGKPTFGFFSVIKNVGAAVGGSLTHGHQQMAFGNTMSTQAYNNWRFYKERRVRFSEHMLAVARDALVIKDYGRAKWIVPDFMRRPYYTMLLLKDVTKQFLHELEAEEVAAMARGWADCAWAMNEILAKLGRSFAYNTVVHNGPGAGLYLEFLPFTQETGGFEQAGIWVCQENPEQVANVMRKHLR